MDVILDHHKAREHTTDYRISYKTHCPALHSFRALLEAGIWFVCASHVSVTFITTVFLGEELWSRSLSPNKKAFTVVMVVADYSKKKY